MTERTLSFEKQGQTYVFRYLPGYEDAIIDAVMDMAESVDCELDWLDAATISFQIAHVATADQMDSISADTE
jgi:hypothetical protein